MSLVSSILYTLDGTGSEIPALDVISEHQEIFLTGTATSIGNYSIVSSGTPAQGTVIVIKYNGALNITTNSNTFSIFGTQITQNVLNTTFEIECIYFNSVWNVIVKPNITTFSISPSSIPANSIGTSQIQNGSVAQPKLAVNSIATTNIQNLAVTSIKIANNTVGTTQLALTSVDSTILADASVSTSKIINASVTNSKLATGANNSIKITDGSATVTDITISNNQILGRLSGNLQGIPITSLGIGLYEVITIPASFEVNEQAVVSVYLPYACKIVNIMIAVQKALSNTDNGSLGIVDDNVSTPILTVTIPASTSVGASIPYNSINYNYAGLNSTGIITVFTSKITPGGKILLSLVVQRT